MSSLNLIPFGKYRNTTFLDIHQKDRHYLQWLNTQPWFQIKFSEMHQSLISFLDDNKEKIVINHETIIIYTDGACKNNGSKKGNVSAGIGVHFSQNNHTQMNDISLKLTIDNPTNNKAELIAILFALQECHKQGIKENIVIYTDSQYCIDAITKWFDQWSKDGSLDKKKNISFIKSIKMIMELLHVSYVHVRSHTKKQDVHSLGNCRADYLATKYL